MPQVKPVYLQSITGCILELLPLHKAIVGFTYNDVSQRALLWADRLMINNKMPTTKEDIRYYLSLGTKVTFKCHSLDASGRDNCGWFIVAAVRQEPHDRQMSKDFHFGIVNCLGTASVLTPRQGVLDFTFNGKTETVLVQASKIYIYGKRLSAKQKVDKTMQYNLDYNFDAIPLIVQENDFGCSWLATQVWKGNRPENLKNYRNELETEPELPLELVAEVKSIAYSPKSLFWRGYGHVCAVINEEYALLFGRLKANRYESILLHRSFFTMSKHRLSSVSLEKMLAIGDRLQFVAVPAPVKFVAGWLASHAAPDLDGHLEESINVLP